MTPFEHIADSGVERLPMWEMYPGFWAYTRWIIYAIAPIVVALFLYGFWLRIKAYRMGRPAADRLADKGGRVGEVLRYWLAQAKVLRETYQGVFHVMLFWGFIVLFIGTAVTVLDEDFWVWVFGQQKFIRGTFYTVFSFFLDLFGLLAIIGLAMATIRRYVMKPKGLDNQAEDFTLLTWIGLILLTGFLAEGARIGVVSGVKGAGAVGYEASSFVGYGLAKVFGASPLLHKLFWTIHILISLSFIAWIPYGKGRHIFTTIGSIFTKSRKPTGSMIEPIPNMMERMEAGEEVELGYKRLEQLTWREIMQLDACARCGRCQDQCPAFNTGKHLSPKQFVQDVKAYWLTKAAAARDAHVELSGEGAPAPAAEGLEGSVADGKFLLKSEANMWGEGDPFAGAVSSAVLWDCTNCMACMEACPVLVEHVPLITYMRRELAMEFDDSESACKTFFKNMDTNANPWGFNPGDRGKWAAEMGVPTVFDNPDYEYLLFLGCMGSYDPKAIKANKALVKLLNEAGISFAILGEMELCCGDSLRRLGNEASFQALVAMFKQTVKDCELDPTFKGKKVITTCPHGFNCLKNEYPAFGFEWEVVHHTELLDQLIKQGKIKMQGGNGKSAVMHDSCFLSRYNHIYEQPRAVLAAAGFKVVEPERHALKTFCCGGGGGRAWLEEHLDEANGVFRINNNRADELGAVGADNIVTACPICGMMFDEACKRPSMEKVMEGTRLLDIAELVAEKAVFTKVEGE